MATMPPKKDKKQESCLFTLFKGIGCFFVGLIILVVILSGIGWYFFNEPVTGIMSEAELPEFDGPKQDDYWALQELLLKRQSVDESEKQEINMTHGQFNAFLASIQVPPQYGFCLHRIKHISQNENVRYYLLGSGYMQKHLTISFTLRSDSSKAKIADIIVNSYELNKDSLGYNHVIDIIKSIAAADKGGRFSKILDNSYDISASDEGIVITL